MQTLTKMPAFFTARGSPRSPVPMLPFNRWIKVWNHLKWEEVDKGMLTARANIYYTLSTVLSAFKFYFIQFPQQPYGICINFILWMRKQVAQHHTASKEFNQDSNSSGLITKFTLLAIGLQALLPVASPRAPSFLEMRPEGW